jgi:hypothetical protein
VSLNSGRGWPESRGLALCCDGESLLEPGTRSTIWANPVRFLFGSTQSRRNATIFYAKQDLAYADKLDEVRCSRSS